MHRTMPPLAAFMALALLAGCVHTPNAKDRESARIRYDLGVEATQNGDVRQAVVEFRKALEKDPGFAQAHNALGLLYHLSLGRPDQAEKAYRTALELSPGFSEAANNLGALYLEQRRYAEAEVMFRQALDDVLYPTPHLARGNLGWALHGQGRNGEAVTELKAAVLTQPRFCQGYRNLGLVLRDMERETDALEAFDRFREACPDSAEAWYEWGRQQQRLGRASEAASAFERCVNLSGGRALGRSCARALDVRGANE